MYRHSDDASALLLPSVPPVYYVPGGSPALKIFEKKICKNPRYRWDTGYRLKNRVLLTFNIQNSLDIITPLFHVVKSILVRMVRTTLIIGFPNGANRSTDQKILEKILSRGSTWYILLGWDRRLM